MAKDTMISFRTTEEFSKSLKKIKKNKVTLSGFIDTILQEFIASQAGQEILLGRAADSRVTTKPFRPSSVVKTARKGISMPARSPISPWAASISWCPE